jgi:hypothetical protein
MASVKAAIEPTSWITPTEARGRLGVSKHQFITILHHEDIAIQQYPGCRMRVSEADVDRLVRQAVRTSGGVKAK